MDMCRSVPGRRVLRPFHIIAKPAGPACNLACSYCYYLDADRRRRAAAAPAVMDEGLLERFIGDYIDAQPEGSPEVNFVWQGGEPTLAGLGFYRRAVAIQKRFGRPGLLVTNSFQTNGTRIDADWACFFRDEGFLVGVSLDGPAGIHDVARRFRDGGGSHSAALRGLECLLRAGVETNLLVVVGEQGARLGAGLYRWLAGLGSPYLHFIPLASRVAPGPGQGYAAAPGAVEAPAWGRFILEVFREWAAHDVGRVFVQEFEAALAARMGMAAPSCTGLAECGRAFALERDGELYACDHFVDADRALGNILEQPLVGLVESDAALDFGEAKRLGLAKACRSCPHLASCYGECPRNRDAEGRNLLCEGWYAFYEGSAPILDAMAAALRNGLAAARYPLFLGT